MPSFESGVAGYIHGVATVEVFFPVDAKGNADCSCWQCDFYSRNTGKCHLTGKVSSYPQKFVGQYCPMVFEEDTNG